jgi:hypothetical protein
MHVYLTPEGKIGVSMDVPNMSGKKKKKKKTLGENLKDRNLR